tara:strand:+ start:295 stop:582 length:288 start_codon:yes stop_codon:yes gene_type:complete
VEHKFEVGDLVELSDFGRTIAGDWIIKYGIIIKGPYSMGLPSDGGPRGFYTAYDIMLGEELIKRIPSEFILRMDKEEENNEQVEKTFIPMYDEEE